MARLASTGPRSEERGKKFLKSLVPRIHGLQRGRAPRSAERMKPRKKSLLAQMASTGPRSEERGKITGTVIS